MLACLNVLFLGYYRGNSWGNSRGGGRMSHNREPRSGSLKFESEFDFESANAQFDKENIEKELKEKLTLGKLEVDSWQIKS